MRKNILIIGLAILVVGAILVAISFYYIPRTLSPLISSVNETLLGSVTSLKPSQAVKFNVSVVNAPALIILLYNDSLGKPLASISSVSQAESVSGMYVLSLVAESNSTLAMGLVNNYSSPVTVRYGYSVIPSSSLSGAVPFIYMLFIGGGVFIVGLIVAIIGVLMKPRTRPSQSSQ